MLRVYVEVLEVIGLLRGVMIAFEKRDPDLARQLKRASASVATSPTESVDSALGPRSLQRHAHQRTL